MTDMELALKAMADVTREQIAAEREETTAAFAAVRNEFSEKVAALREQIDALPAPPPDRGEEIAECKAMLAAMAIPPDQSNAVASLRADLQAVVSLIPPDQSEAVAAIKSGLSKFSERSEVDRLAEALAALSARIAALEANRIEVTTLGRDSAGQVDTIVKRVG